MSDSDGQPKQADLAMFGLARRAGCLEIGFDASLRALQDGRSHLLVLAADASERTRERILRRRGSVNVVVPDAKDRLGRAVGRDEAAVMAVTDEGFAKALATRFGVQTEVKVAVSAEQHAGL